MNILKYTFKTDMFSDEIIKKKIGSAHVYIIFNVVTKFNIKPQVPILLIVQKRTHFGFKQPKIFREAKIRIIN